MPALAITAAHTSQVVRPDLPYVVLLKEQGFSEAIARARVAPVAKSLIQGLAEVDPEGEYSLIVSRSKQFDWAIVDLRMQPNMLIAEAIGRTEAALLLRELVRIDPGNMRRYGIARLRELSIQD